jgi:2-keto-3-deoxy-L-rhamnonate aldolase RhmA
MANNLKARLDAGKACVNGWLAIPSGFSAEVMAGCGWDSVTVDIQHGVQDYQSMVQCFQAMDRFPITPLVRVPWNEPGIIGKCLDGGAWGIICPMVNNAAEAKALADACLYPPIGKRSNGPIRAAAYGVASSYQSTANSEVLVIPMIETQDGIDNIDEILSVPGISGIYIGPSGRAEHSGDLSEAARLVQKAWQVRGPAQRLGFLRRADVQNGLSLRHHSERLRTDGQGGARGSRVGAERGRRPGGLSFHAKGPRA